MNTFTPAEPKFETSKPTPSTSWIGLAHDVFSFPVMCMFLLASVILAYAPLGISIGEPDIWWRLRGAHDILQYHSLPRVDTYSFTAAGSPWISVEWLSDILFFLAFKAKGLQGIVVVYFAAMALIFVGVYYRSCRAGADCKDAAVATLGGICLACVSLAPRPMLFGWVCMMGLLMVIDQFRRSGKALWLLPPLFALWINLHGSWIFGMAVLAITIVSGAAEGKWGLVVAHRWTRTELKKLLVALAVSFAALFVNPFGYRLVVFPFAFFRMQGFMQYVEYWRPVDFNTRNGQLALLLIFALLAAALFSRRRWRLDEVMLTGFALGEALLHVRFLDLAALIIVPILAPHLTLFPPYQRELDKPWLNGIIMAAVLGSMIFFFPTTAQLQQQVDQDYPTAALEYVQRQHINGRIFHPAEFGGFIEWNAPALKSFVDGRVIFVQNGVFDDCFSALTIREPFKVLDKYRIDYVLLERTWPLAYLLEHSSAWRIIYSDKGAVIFERAPAVAAVKNGVGNISRRQSRLLPSPYSNDRLAD
jgi:hypothetical protein